MDDPVSVILLVLFGVLGVFILVRIVKYASRTVDKEQKNKQPQTPTAKPREVRLGMTTTEVEATLGLPETKVDLGEKAVYKYKNMTVEFKDGKVADVR